MLASPAVIQTVPLPSITGPLRVAGRAGKTVTVQYACSQQSPVWGVGTGGNDSTITGITPLGNGTYTFKLHREREWVIISDVPTASNNGCSSIRVRVVGHVQR